MPGSWVRGRKDVPREVAPDLRPVRNLRYPLGPKPKAVLRRPRMEVGVSLRMVPSPLELRAARRDLPRVDWWLFAVVVLAGAALALLVGA